jgi:hypothetical protein
VGVWKGANVGRAVDGRAVDGTARRAGEGDIGSSIDVAAAQACKAISRQFNSQQTLKKKMQRKEIEKYVTRDFEGAHSYEI